MRKTLLTAIAALLMATGAAHADSLDWDKLMAAQYGACDLDVRIHDDEKGQHLDVHMACERTSSDDEVFRFTGLNNPQDGSPKKRVCPRAPHIDGGGAFRPRGVHGLRPLRRDGEEPARARVQARRRHPTHLQQRELLRMSARALISSSRLMITFAPES